MGPRAGCAVASQAGPGWAGRQGPVPGAVSKTAADTKGAPQNWCASVDSFIAVVDDVADTVVDTRSK